MQIPDSVFDMVGESRGLSLEGEGGHIIYYFKSKVLTAPEILEALDHVSSIVDALAYDREKEFV